MKAPTYADIHYDAGLLSGLLEGLAELHNENSNSDAVVCLIEIACRAARSLVTDLDVKASAGRRES